MDQGVILSSKLLYRRKQLNECVVFFMDDEEMDNRGEQTLKKIKEYSTKSAIYNWANSWMRSKYLHYAKHGIRFCMIDVYKRQFMYS